MNSNSSNVLMSKLNPENNQELSTYLVKCLEHYNSKPSKYLPSDFEHCITESLRFFKNNTTNNIETSFTKWCKWLEWYIKYHPEQITPKDIPNQIKTGKVFIHGEDKEGRPCIVIRQCLHIPSETDIEEMLKLQWYVVEMAMKKAETTSKKQVCIIMDRVNFGWSNFDKRLIGNSTVMGLMNEYYSEKVHKIYIYPINWIFHSIMKIASPFIPTESKEKLMYINSENELKQYFTEDNWLRELGGTSDYVYKFEG